MCEWAVQDKRVIEPSKYICKIRKKEKREVFLRNTVCAIELAAGAAVEAASVPLSATLVPSTL
jgi:hypothetical protein